MAGQPIPKPGRKGVLGCGWHILFFRAVPGLELDGAGSTLCPQFPPSRNSMKDMQPARVRLGAFELDLKAGELHPADAGEDVGNGRILLSEQPFRLLVLLVEREGQIATREEIKKEFWPTGHRISGALSAPKPCGFGTTVQSVVTH